MKTHLWKKKQNKTPGCLNSTGTAEESTQETCLLAWCQTLHKTLKHVTFFFLKYILHINKQTGLNGSSYSTLTWCTRCFFTQNLLQSHPWRLVGCLQLSVPHRMLIVQTTVIWTHSLKPGKMDSCVISVNPTLMKDKNLILGKSGKLLNYV